MDDLNRKRLEKGRALSYYGKSADEVTDMLTEAVEAHGFNGRTYTGPQENPVGRYRLSKWLPFGEYHEYQASTEVAKLLGYELVATQKDDEGWFHLYFNHDNDRGGCFRRVDIWEEEVRGICRSDVLDDGMVDPVSEFTTVRGEALTSVKAFRSGRIELNFQSGGVEREWSCPLDRNKAPEASRVVRVPGKADFDRPLIALRIDSG